MNESTAEQPLQATVKVYDAASRLIGQETKAVKVGYRDVVPVFDLKKYDGKPHFVALRLTETDGTPVADNFFPLLPGETKTVTCRVENLEGIRLEDFS